MARITCTRKLAFDAGHRVYKHESKCRFPHGHRYTVEITAHAEALDHLGRIIDFGIIKERIGEWIDEHWDHSFIVFADDHQLISALKSTPDCRFFTLPYNPTAENIAAYLGEQVCPGLMSGSGIRVVKVRVWETPNCYADWTIS